RDRRRPQPPHDLVDHGLGRAAALRAEERLRLPPERADGLGLGLQGLIERRALAAADDARLRLAQPVTRMEAQVDLATVPPHELVQRPGGDRRLAELSDLRGLLAPAVGAQLLHEPAPFRAEFVEIDAVEPTGGLVERHLSSLNHPHRMTRPAPRLARV